MKGAITTYLPEKKYGFIKGDDGKDYFFHQDSFVDKGQIEKICEEVFVEFEQKATPKGYKAYDLTIINPTDILTYVVPDDFIASRSATVKGWDVLEDGEWIVHGSARDSPDASKRDLINSATQVGANSVVGVEYYKTTGSSGNYQFSVHNHRAKIVTLAKKNAKGRYKLDDLIGINQRASKLKKQLVEQTNRSKRKRNIVWTVLISLLGVMWLSGYGNLYLTIILAVLGIIFGHSKNYDWWLERR